MPTTDFRPMINEWTGEVAKELDFTLEALNQARVGQLLEQFGGTRLSVPTLHPSLGGSAGTVPDPSGVSRRNGMRGAGAKNLLVMEFIEGERVTDGAEAHLDYAGKVWCHSCSVVPTGARFNVLGIFIRLRTGSFVSEHSRTVLKIYGTNGANS